MAKKREITKSRQLAEQILARIEEDRERILRLYTDIEQQREDNKDVVLINGRLWTDTLAALQNTTTLQINAVKLIQKDELTFVVLDARTQALDDEAEREEQELARQLEESARNIDINMLRPDQTISSIAPLAPVVIDTEFTDNANNSD